MVAMFILSLKPVRVSCLKQGIRGFAKVAQNGLEKFDFLSRFQGKSYLKGRTGATSARRNSRKIL
jgi:hypothetical protein